MPRSCELRRPYFDSNKECRLYRAKANQRAICSLIASRPVIRINTTIVQVKHREFLCQCYPHERVRRYEGVGSRRNGSSNGAQGAAISQVQVLFSYVSTVLSSRYQQVAKWGNQTPWAPTSKGARKRNA